MSNMKLDFKQLLLKGNNLNGPTKTTRGNVPKPATIQCPIDAKYTTGRHWARFWSDLNLNIFRNLTSEDSFVQFEKDEFIK